MPWRLGKLMTPIRIFLYSEIEPSALQAFENVTFMGAWLQNHAFFRLWRRSGHAFQPETGTSFQTIYDSTRALGLVNSQHEFGRLCGRKASWFSSSNSVDCELSLAALITVAKALERLPTNQVLATSELSSSG